MNIPKELQISKNILKIEEIKRGYKKRKKYIIETTDDKYFVKVLPYKASQEEVEKTKWIHKIYKDRNIPIVPLKDVILKENKTILIYNYFYGKDLKESTLTLKEVENYGMKVASEVKKMNEIQQYPDLFKKFDLDEHYNKYIDRLNRVIDNEEEKIYGLFNKTEIRKLILRLKELKEKIRSDDVMLNHNDIKIANIMLDEDGKFYFVDIEPIDLTYRGFNINYSIFTFLYNNNIDKREKRFLKGFIKEYDTDKCLIKEFEYFIITDFINELEMLLNRHYNYLKSNIAFIKSMLFNENNTLTHVLYD